jgi:hypothetical protein
VILWQSMASTSQKPVSIPIASPFRQLTTVSDANHPNNRDCLPTHWQLHPLDGRLRHSAIHSRRTYCAKTSLTQSGFVSSNTSITVAGQQIYELVVANNVSAFAPYNGPQPAVRVPYPYRYTNFCSILREILKPCMC